MTYNTKYNFVKLKNSDDIKKLPHDSMFNLMKEHHKKFNSLNNLKPRKIANKTKRLEVLIYVDYIYNELYKIYKNKYNREIDRLNVENKKMLDCKQLKLDDHQYSSEEEQEKQEKQEKQEEQDKQDKKKTFNPEEVIEWMINREKLPINNELFKKHFKLERSTLMYKVLHETNNDK